ncbi:hypothetical protein CIT292_10525 [Citrobacter youngae ATCC 29220]|uniref:Uncharacterized protein n=1 Tax=Citrobacter youngae ATCC 29220 TaxID=500640 RepID=D4BJ09_9ENTR|nr:hypothetical protein CIT292_10525 [Citrobacter youngae ATCC 29220]
MTTPFLFRDRPRVLLIFRISYSVLLICFALSSTGSSDGHHSAKQM